MTPVPSIGDRLLHWTSERGSGTWSEYRDATASVLGDGSKTLRPWQLARNASILGHLDLDWETSRWSVAKPCLALSPGMGLWAYLAGWRTHALMQRYERAASLLDVYPSEIRQGPNPRAQLLKVGSIATLESVAEELHLPIVYDPALRLAELVVEQQSGGTHISSAPPFDEPLKFFEVDSLRWTDGNLRRQDGLYQFELHGRKQFRLLRDSKWFYVDRSAGQMQVLCSRDDILVWHKPTSDGAQPPVLAVRAQVSLPVLAERAAVAATGLLPKYLGGWNVYQNVNYPTANRIATGLGQQLGIAKQPFTVHTKTG